MEYTTTFDIGDKVWVIAGEPQLLTVGKIIVEHTDSPGIPGETWFDNFKPQNSYTEKYMCVESGIGTGSVWELGKNIFGSLDECRRAIKQKEENDV